MVDSTMTATDEIFDYDVVDASGKKIGTVNHLWADDTTGQTAFIGAKTGWLATRTYVIPLAQAQIDTGDRVIRLPYLEDQIKDAPHLDPDDELEPNEQDTISRYYGLGGADGAMAGQAIGATSGYAADTTTGYTTDTTTGYAADTTPDRDVTYDTTRTGAVAEGYDRTQTTDREISVPLAEERLSVDKRAVESGNVRLRKIVRSEHVSVPVELRREQVEVERVPAATTREAPVEAFTEKEINIPMMREEVVATKDTVVTGEARVRKSVESETQMVEDDVRKEDVVLEGDARDQVVDRRSADTDSTTDRTSGSSGYPTDRGSSATGYTDRS